MISLYFNGFCSDLLLGSMALTLARTSPTIANTGDQNNGQHRDTMIHRANETLTVGATDYQDQVNELGNYKNTIDVSCYNHVQNIEQQQNKHTGCLVICSFQTRDEKKHWYGLYMVCAVICAA